MVEKHTILLPLKSSEVASFRKENNVEAYVMTPLNVAAIFSKLDLEKGYYQSPEAVE
jgi:hypothetical protein